MHSSAAVAVGDVVEVQLAGPGQQALSVLGVVEAADATALRVFIGGADAAWAQREVPRRACRLLCRGAAVQWSAQAKEDLVIVSRRSEAAMAECIPTEDSLATSFASASTAMSRLPVELDAAALAAARAGEEAPQLPNMLRHVCGLLESLCVWRAPLWTAAAVLLSLTALALPQPQPHRLLELALVALFAAVLLQVEPAANPSHWSLAGLIVLLLASGVSGRAHRATLPLLLCGCAAGAVWTRWPKPHAA